MSERIGRRDVYVGSVLQGETTVTSVAGNEQWSYTYRSEATEDVCLTMPRELPTYGWDGILPAFEQHLPEMDLSLFPVAIWKLIARDHAGLLWVAGQRRLGRVRFTRPGEAVSETVPLGLTSRDIANTTDGNGLLADLLSRTTTIPGVSGCGVHNANHRLCRWIQSRLHSLKPPALRLPTQGRPKTAKRANDLNGTYP